MGLYINWKDEAGTDLQKVGKADRLRKDHGAVEFEGRAFSDVPEGKMLVYVAENRHRDELTGLVPQGIVGYDAAGIVTDAERFEEMTDPDDPRTIQKLLIDRAEAVKLVPAIQSLGL
jgi:hypothetical protein